MTRRDLGFVALGGAIGAPTRYVIERAARTRWPSQFSWGTFAVNVSGSLALGIVVGFVLAQGADADLRTFVGTGFLGAYTTFSAYSHETVRVGTDGPPRHGLAVACALGSVVASVLAAAAGLAITGAW